jgi:uncharacterized protein YeaO (DUF488 family)
MPIKTKRVYDDPEPEDGHRLLVMRRWPRGVPKSSVDGWEKELGAPADLITDWKSGSIKWDEFVKRYRKAMRGQKQKIGELRDRSRSETITLLCSCKDEQRCHRTLLKKMIEKGGRA